MGGGSWWLRMGANGVSGGLGLKKGAAGDKKSPDADERGGSESEKKEGGLGPLSYITWDRIYLLSMLLKA